MSLPLQNQVSPTLNRGSTQSVVVPHAKPIGGNPEDQTPPVQASPRISADGQDKTKSVGASTATNINAGLNTPADPKTTKATTGMPAPPTMFSEMSNASTSGHGQDV